MKARCNVADEAPSLGTRAGGLLITFNLFYQLSNSHTIGEKIEKKVRDTLLAIVQKFGQ
jgi:hypothetical protein